MFSIDINESDDGRHCDILVEYSLELSSEARIPLNGISKESLEKEIDVIKNMLLQLVVKEAINEKGYIDA